MKLPIAPLLTKQESEWINFSEITIRLLENEDEIEKFKRKIWKEILDTHKIQQISTCYSLR